MKNIIALFILFGLTILSCNLRHSFIEPEKVKGIPSNAFWQGGIDGGNWFIVDSIKISSNTVNFRIYNDKTGELIENRPFKLQCNTNSENIWSNIQSEIDGFDGEKIILNSTQQGNKHCYFQ